MARFNKNKVSIPEYSLSTTISTFRKGFRPNSDLYKELKKYPYRTMEDVLNKIQAQTQWEEDEANYLPSQDRKSAPNRDHRDNKSSHWRDKLRRGRSDKLKNRDMRVFLYARTFGSISRLP